MREIVSGMIVRITTIKTIVNQETKAGWHSSARFWSRNRGWMTFAKLAFVSTIHCCTVACHLTFCFVICQAPDMLGCCFREEIFILTPCNGSFAPMTFDGQEKQWLDSGTSIFLSATSYCKRMMPVAWCLRWNWMVAPQDLRTTSSSRGGSSLQAPVSLKPTQCPAEFQRGLHSDLD